MTNLSLTVPLSTLIQRMVRSVLFSTTTSPLLDFYPHRRSMSTFSLTVLVRRELVQLGHVPEVL